MNHIRPKCQDREIRRPVFSLLTEWARRWLGLDRAILYTVLARGTGIVGSTVTVLLIVHFLSPVQQGYYYTLLSLVSLQAIFELGFSFVIQQLAAHETVHLEIHADGSITGDAVAHARLASALQLALKWYLRGAVVLVSVLLPLGIYFFSRHPETNPPVHWLGPWTLAAIACCGTFFVAPFYSFVDGCGQVRQVAAMRFAESAAAAGAAWSMMLIHEGLYAPGMVIVAQIGVGCVFLYRRRRLLLGLLRHKCEAGTVHWKAEVLPFQWRIAVSWLSAYFTSQAFIPILFVLCGAVVSGQMGMSLSITGYLATLILGWTSTKATPFGQMIARGRFEEVNQIFFRTLRQSGIILVLIAVGCESAVVAFQGWFPRLAHRMVSPLVFGFLLLTMMSNFLIQSMAIYLRCFKREPFLWLYLSTAGLSLTLVFLTARHWGALGAAVSYWCSTGIVGLLAAVMIFRRYRSRYIQSLRMPLQAEVVS